MKYHNKTFTRPRNDVFEASDTALCLGASHNMSPLNNRCVVIKCFSSPKDHCVTRGYMQECVPTLNAAKVESGNNRPFIVEGFAETGKGYWMDLGVSSTLRAEGENRPSRPSNCIVKKEKRIGIDQQGGKGGANYTVDRAPTLASNSHGTPHGVASIKQSNNQTRRKEARAVLDRCGNNWKNGKGGCGILVHEEHCPCLATMFHPFVITT